MGRPALNRGVAQLLVGDGHAGTVGPVEMLIEVSYSLAVENTRDAGSYDEMKKILVEQGGFVRVYFEPSRESEQKIKEETKATVRCIPFTQPGSSGKCVYTGVETSTQVLFALAY